jgi:CRISPR-associated protein Cas1
MMPISADLFHMLALPATLDAAWERVRANGGCAGGDGETIAQFQRGNAARILALSSKILDGRYRPRDLRILHIPKKGGGTRPLAVPSVQDRVVQTACAGILSPILDPIFDDASFAYRPGRSVLMAVRAIEKLRKRGFTHVVEADITRCFERIPHPPLLDQLERVLGTKHGAHRLVDLIALWLEHMALELQTPGIGLAQGSPLSPLLANLYLDQFDNAIDKMGIHFVRFADDFVLLCKNESAARRALDHAGDVLELHGLELRSDKTRIIDFDRGFAFLGHLFIRSMVLKQVADPAENPVEIMRDLAARDEQTNLSAQQEADAERQERAKGYDRGQRVLYIVEPGRRLKHFSFDMTHFASSVCRLARRSPQGVMGLRTRISTRPGGRLRWPTGFVFGGVWRRYTARPMRRIAQRAVPCQTTRQKQTKWIISKEKCFNASQSQFYCQDDG